MNAKDKKVAIGAGIVVGLASIVLLVRKAAAAPLGIKLSNLTINPSPCNPGQGVTVSVTVLNESSQGITATITLGGDFPMATQTVTLNAGQSKPVGFTITPQVAGTYQVSVDGLLGSFICTEAPVANIVLSDLVISPSTCYPGETITISVLATNQGTITGSRTITCTIT